MSSGNSPFDYVKAINQTKKDIIVDDVSERDYNPFITNRALSYHYDTVLLANEMNMNSHLDNKLQFDFLRMSVRRKSRFAKWAKPSEIKKIQAIKEFYKYSDEKARQVADLISDDDILEIQEKMYKGGLQK